MTNSSPTIQIIMGNLSGPFMKVKNFEAKAKYKYYLACNRRTRMKNRDSTGSF